MARKDIPRVDGNEFKERQLKSAEVQRGIDQVTREIGDAVRTCSIQIKAPNRCIYLGSTQGRQAIYPTCDYRWSNNRAVADGIVKACRKQGYQAQVLEPQNDGQGWSEIRFEVIIPSTRRLIMS